jgi:hypothetical protein
MLEGLYNINWSELSHAYGSAEQVPEWIRALASPNKEEREDALEQLVVSVNHQGSVYSATPHVVPFIIELLQGNAPDKLSLIYMLHGFAEPYAELNPTPDDLNGLEPDSATLRLWKAMYGEEYNWRSTQEQNVRTMRECYHAVREYLDVYLPFLGDEDPDIRQITAELVALFAEDAARIAWALREQIDAEADEETRSRMIDRLGALLRHNARQPSPIDASDYVFYLEDALEAGGYAEYLMSIALALLRIMGLHTPEVAVQALIAGIEAGEYPNSPDLNDIYQELRVLGPGRALRALIAAFDVTQSDHELHDAARALLDETFDLRVHGWRQSYLYGPNGIQMIDYSWDTGSPLVDRFDAPLNEPQRDVLTIIVEHDPFWEIPDRVFALYGLPADRDELYRLLED